MLKINNKKLLILVLFLSAFGIIMIYSASNYSAEIEMQDKYYFVKKQLIALAIAIVVFFVAKSVDINKIKASTPYLYILSVVLLGMVFIPGVGIENYGATRWINLGITTFQPSELAKFALVMVISKILDKESSSKTSAIIKIVFCALVIVGLILLEPNMSVAICIVLVTFVMLIVGGMKLKHTIILGVPAVLAGVSLILLEPYRFARLIAFVDPWSSPLAEGYQLIQSFYALAGGGLLGVGLFNSRQKYLFLPFAESDFIYSIICEECGFLGGVMIIILFTMIVVEGVNIAMHAKSRYETYLAIGITSIIAIQTLLNLAVVTGSIPPTGLPLPFVSYGGTSLVVFFFFVGILENIGNNSLDIFYVNKIY